MKAISSGHRQAVAGAVGSVSLLLLTLSACEKPARITLKDTEQRTFDAQCKGGECKLQGSSPGPTAPKPDGAEPSVVLHQASRFYAVCDVWKTGSNAFQVNPIDCRLLACKSDADCPPAKGLPRGACTNGLCIEPSAALTSEDGALLCLAGTGLPAATSQQIERFALGSNCGSPCKVPSVCRQP